LTPVLFRYAGGPDLGWARRLCERGRGVVGLPPYRSCPAFYYFLWSSLYIIPCFRPPGERGNIRAWLQPKARHGVRCDRLARCSKGVSLMPREVCVSIAMGTVNFLHGRGEIPPERCSRASCFQARVYARCSRRSRGRYDPLPLLSLALRLAWAQTRQQPCRAFLLGSDSLA